MLVSQATKSAAGLLGDAAQVTWTNSVLIQPAIDGYEELCNDLVANGFSLFRESANPVTVLAGSLVLNAPTDLYEPITLKEKAVGEPDSAYVEMKRFRWTPNDQQQQSLRYWDWRKNAINLLGATSDRVVLLKYLMNSAGVIIDENSNINIINGAGLLGAKIASLAATHIGKNTEQGQILEGRYQDRLNKYIQAEAKNQGSIAVKQLPYRIRRRR